MCTCRGGRSQNTTGKDRICVCEARGAHGFTRPHNKPHYYNIFLLLIIPENKKPYYYNVFLFFLIPEHNKLCLFNAFLLFLLPEHHKLYLFNAFLLFMLSGKVQREGW